MKKLLLSFGMLAVTVTASKSFAQDCSGNRYKNDIFTELDSVKNVKYGQNFKQDGATNEDLYMDIYYPKNDTDQSRATIILAHGGSFIGGDRTQVAALCRQMAMKGYVVVTMSYRLLSVDVSVLGDTPKAFKREVARAIHDMKAAVRFMRKSVDNGNPYGINPNIIIVGGVSAGAILANHVTYLDDLQKLTNAGETDLVTYINGQGGLEGNSGNPGYSSRPSMSLSMCGALMDTTFLTAGQQPFYGVHTQPDQTVPYLYGQPNIGVPVAVNLYGDSLIYNRAINVGVAAKYKHYATGGHCEFGADYYTDMMAFTYKQLCEEGVLNTTKVADKFYFSAYPNPSSSVVTVEIPSNQWNSTIQIVDVLGKVVLTSTIPPTQSTYNVNVASFAKGVYQVKVSTNDGRSAVQRIVVE